jgi:phospholipase/carboxylesterase
MPWSVPAMPLRPGTRTSGLGLLLALLAAGCWSDPPLPPAWPASARANLDTELRFTAEELKLAEPESLESDTPIEAVLDAPFVRAREGESAGLSYIEVVLGDVDIDAALPLVLMLHGRGDRPRIPGGPFACVSMPMRIILPRAPDRLGPGYTWLSVRVAQGRTEQLSQELAMRADQIAMLLADVSSLRPTLGRPVATGFSQGGMLTFALAARHPDMLSSAFPLAGWLPPLLWPDSADGLPVIRSVHGTDDDTIPLPPTREAVAHLVSLGANVELLEFPGTGHVMSQAMNEQFELWLDQTLREQAPALVGRPRDTSVELGPSDESATCYAASVAP